MTMLVPIRQLMKCLLAALLVALLMAGPSGHAQDTQMSPISGDPQRPRRHFRVRDPVRLDATEAERLYRIVLPSLLAGYASSDNEHARAYPQWKRENSMPYLSTTHGNHYLSNYTNELAREYSKAASAAVMPRGAVIAKDSFSTTNSGALVLGPLLLMDKDAARFQPGQRGLALHADSPQRPCARHHQRQGQGQGQRERLHTASHATWRARLTTTCTSCHSVPVRNSQATPPSSKDTR
jgi:hypothetical protein